MKKNLRIIHLLVFALLAMVAQAQQRTVSGTVTDAANEPMPGVTVVVAGTTRGAITDSSGKFQLSVEAGDKNLTFSFIGYTTQTVPLADKTTLRVRMESDVTDIDEVVVVGYDTMRKRDLTSAVASVSEEKLKASISTNIDQALQGRIAGVQVTTNSGQPGGATSIRIRGASSVTGSNEPLYIVDGVVFQGNGSTIGGFDWAGGANGQNRVNPLSTINPADIVSVDVLKDASAAAIYGAQAANGVILITTRRGKQGESKVSYEGYVASQNLAKKLGMMNLQEYAVYQNQISAELEREPNQNYLDPSILGKGTDWQDEVFRSALMQSHNVSISGGNDKTQYSISGGYFDQDGIIIGSNLDRFTTRMSLDNQVRSWMRVGASMAYAETNEKITLNDGGDGVVLQALLMQPDVPVYDLDGNFAGPNSVVGASQYNPVALALQRFNTLKRNRITGNFYASADLMKGLTFRTEYAYDINRGHNIAFHPRYEWGALKNDINKMMERNEYSKYWGWKNLLTYDKTIHKHNFKILLGHEMQKSAWRGSSLIKQNFTTDDMFVMTDDGTFVNNQGWKDAATQMSYFGRLNYNFGDKYLASFSVRGDGSSKFGEDNQWGYFPSGSLAWRITGENFMKNIPIISNLKLRLGYGAVGNMPGSTYLYGSSMMSVVTPFGTGYRLSKFPNPGLKWETTEQYSLGLDLGLLNNRIEVTFEPYKKFTRDLLLQISVPSYIGGSDWNDIQAPFANVGKMENKGFDLSVKTHNIKRSKFNWYSDLTLSRNVNTVKQLNDDNAAFYGKLNWYSEFQTATLTREGLPMGSFYGYVMDGIFSSAEDIANHAVQIKDPQNGEANYIDRRQGVWIGDVKYKDLNDDGVIDANDQKVIGDPNPEFTFGFNNSFTYKNFDLNIYLAGSYGADILNYTLAQIEGQTSIWNNQSDRVVDRAQIVMRDPNGDPNDITNYYLANEGTNIPRVTTNDNNRNNRMSTRFIEDGSYLRIQNISLGYTLPQAWVSKISLQRIRLYANVQNVYTFTNYSGYDPEIGAFNQNAMLQNVDMGRYPTPRVYTLGVNVDF